MKTIFAKYPFENPNKQDIIANSMSELKITGRLWRGCKWHTIIIGMNPSRIIAIMRVHGDDFPGCRNNHNLAKLIKC